jgi:tRNA-dihydrouridine synthase C
LVLEFWRIVTTRLDSKAQAGRLKQWLNFLRRRFPEAEVAYQALKTVNSPREVEAWLQAWLLAEFRVDCRLQVFDQVQVYALADQH